MFTADQMRRIREIVQRYHEATGVAFFHAGASEDVARQLRDAGLVDDASPDLIAESSAYGRLLAETGDARLMDREPADIVRALEAAAQRPLDPAEKAATDMAARHAGQYIQGLANRVLGTITAAVTGAESDYTPDQIRAAVQDATEGNRLRRETVGRLRSDLRAALPGWERDFHRLALTESNNAIQEGVAQQLEHDHGDPLVSKIPRPDACPDCMRLYTDGGTPKVFRLSDLRANGSNVGRKRRAWLAVVEATHPWCACVLVRVPEGMVWEGNELVVDETDKSEYLADPDLIKANRGDPVGTTRRRKNGVYYQKQGNGKWKEIHNPNYQHHPKKTAYRLHDIGSIPKVLRFGLLPGDRTGPSDKDWKATAEGKLWLSEHKGRYKPIDSTREIELRFPWPSDTKEAPDQPQREFHTKQTVPADKIEAKVEGKWMSLRDAYLSLIRAGASERAFKSLTGSPFKLAYRTEFAGLPISVENRKGSKRYWTDERTGTEGSTKQHYPYGYIRGVDGKDDDEVDCYLGPDPKARNVFVVHQRIWNPKTDTFHGHDEDKVMLGFPSSTAAKKAYLKHFHDARFFGSMTTLALDKFKAILEKHKGRKLTVWKSAPEADELLKAWGHKYKRRWRNAKGEWEYEYETKAKPKHHQTDLFAPAGKRKKEPAKRAAPKNPYDDVIKSDPALTEEQKKKPRSKALKIIGQKDFGDPSEWALPAGARVEDPWTEKQLAALAGDPKAKWSHPDYGKGKGQAPWEKSDDWHPDLHSYDWIVINSSGGKDSQAQLTQVVELADKAGVPREKLVVVHADLGRVEWEGTKSLAREQAEHYGLRFEVVQREQNDLLDHIEERHGDLIQRDADVAVLAEAGIRTWGDLHKRTPAKIYSLLGMSPGTSKHAGKHRAKTLWEDAEEKIHVVGTANYGRQIRVQEERVTHFTKKAKAAKSGSKTEISSLKKVVAAKEKIESLKKKLPADIEERRAAKIDYGKSIAWPSAKARYCTSDHKRAEVKKLHTALKNEHVAKHGEGKPVRILNALGIRLQESDARLAMDPFSREESTGTRTVDRWYPIHRWHESRVWDVIRDSKLPSHKAYNLGMRRLS